MSKAIIVYSSWAGATHEVANEIGRVFRENSYLADIKNAQEKIDTNSYDAYVIGTSIHAGQTMGSFRKFIKQNLANLEKKPTAIFVVCANMMNDEEKNRNETLTWLNNSIDKYESLNPISIGLFGGAFLTDTEDFGRLNFIIQKMILAMSKKITEDHKKTDFRDWSSIRNWAENLIETITDQANPK